jgi:hypothetical protein
MQLQNAPAKAAVSSPAATARDAPPSYPSGSVESSVDAAMRTFQTMRPPQQLPQQRSSGPGVFIPHISSVLVVGQHPQPVPMMVQQPGLLSSAMFQQQSQLIRAPQQPLSQPLLQGPAPVQGLSPFAFRADLYQQSPAPAAAPAAALAPLPAPAAIQRQAAVIQSAPLQYQPYVPGSGSLGAAAAGGPQALPRAASEPPSSAVSGVVPPAGPSVARSPLNPPDPCI